MAASMRVAVFVNKCLKLATVSKIRQCSLTTNKQMDALLVRHFSYGHVMRANDPLTAPEMKKAMESLTDKFAEAREMLGDARESQGTVYFSEDMEEAQTAVSETLTEYKNLLDRLSDKQRQEVLSTLGLRMEELKAQQAAIEEALHDH